MKPKDLAICRSAANEDEFWKPYPFCWVGTSQDDDNSNSYWIQYEQYILLFKGDKFVLPFCLQHPDWVCSQVDHVLLVLCDTKPWHDLESMPDSGSIIVAQWIRDLRFGVFLSFMARIQARSIHCHQVQTYWHIRLRVKDSFPRLEPREISQGTQQSSWFCNTT